MLEYNAVVGTSYVSPPDDYGIVVVIDGGRSNANNEVRLSNLIRKSKDHSIEVRQRATTHGSPCNVSKRKCH